jgi:hypothetical protein
MKNKDVAKMWWDQPTQEGRIFRCVAAARRDASRPGKQTGRTIAMMDRELAQFDQNKWCGLSY